MLPEIPDHYRSCRFTIFYDSPTDELEDVCRGFDNKKLRYISASDHWSVFTAKLSSGERALMLYSLQNESITDEEDATSLIMAFVDYDATGWVAVNIRPTYALKDIPQTGFIKSLAGVSQTLGGMSFDLVGADFSVVGENVSEFSWTTDSEQVSAKINWRKMLTNIPRDVFKHTFTEADKAARFLVLNEK